MNLLKAIRERRAVRDFTPEPVSAGMMYQLLSAASWAPSAMNEQPWHFTVITDRDILDQISISAKTWLLQNLPNIPRPAHFRDTLADPNFHIFYNAPSLIVISTTSAGPWMIEDAALAAQNLMLMATALGLGTCWVGFAQGWLNTSEGHNILVIPEGALVVAPIIVGHPRTIPPRVARKTPVVSWIGHRQFDGESHSEEPILDESGP